jgi:hypothetical protein
VALFDDELGAYRRPLGMVGRLRHGRASALSH